jgi:hypothetical protein
MLKQRDWNSSFWADASIVAVLWLLILLFVAPALQPGRVLMPLDLVTEMWPPWQKPNQPVAVHNVLISDVVNYIYPVKTFAADAIRDGTFPLWNPYTLTGYPFTYNTQAGIFYPLFPLYLLFDGAQAVDLTIVLQMMLGALFMVMYLRQIGLRRLAALFGSVLFLFNGMMVVWLEWQVVHAAIIWLPLQLFFVERVAGELEQDSRGRAVYRYAILAGIAFAIPWLGGHWNWTLYSSLLFGVYTLWRLWPFARKQFAKVAGLWAWMFGVGVGLSAIQVIPALYYLSQSHRSAFTWAESAERGLLRIANIMLVPNFYGTPLDLNYWGPDTLNFNEATAYLSVFGVLLTGLAIFVRRDRWTLFYTVVGVIGLLWALGTPAYRVLHVLPVFNGLFPSRAVYLVLFCGAILAALTLDRLLSAESMRLLPTWRKRGALLWCLFIVILAIVFVAIYRVEVIKKWSFLAPFLLWFVLLFGASVLLLWLRWRGNLSPTVFGVLATMLVVVDLFAFGINYNPITSTEQLYPETEIGRFLQADLGEYRVVTLQRGWVYPPNTSLVDRLENVSGYEPGILTRLVAYIAAAEGGDPIHTKRKLLPQQAVGSPLLDALNARYYLTIRDLFGNSPVLDQKAGKVASGSALMPLEPWQAIGEPIVMSDAGLQRIDVPLTIIDGAEGMVRARVFSADRGLDFANDAVAVSSVANGTASFYFTPFPSEWGRDFYFELQFEGTGDVLVGTNASGGMSYQPYYLSRPPVAIESAKARAFENIEAFDRAYTVSTAIVADGVEDALAQVVANQDQLNELVVIELNGQVLPDLLESDSAESSVKITDYNLNDLALQADMTAPGFVVVSDAWYPGWQARIDGERVPLYRANSIVRAVFVPEGDHQIEMVFRPMDFTIAAAVSGGTLVVALIGLAWPDAKRQRGREQGTDFA